MGEDAAGRTASTPVPIAVVGIACRYPGADGPGAFWENVVARRTQFRRMPDCRLPLGDYHDPDCSAPDKTYHTRAALLTDFDFDWRARQVPQSTVQATDIAHWLALEVALAAVADAGYAKEALPRERTAVVVGNSLTGEQWRAAIMRLRWPYVARLLGQAAQVAGVYDGAQARLLAAAEHLFKSPLPPFNKDTLAGYLSNTIAGRICNFLDLGGGGYVVDGACASSLLAVITAARTLVQGEADVALAGGVDVSLDTFELIGFAKTGALSAGEARVYDQGADGFLPGEGSGFVVLKRLGDARRDGDHVYAVLHGWGVSSDGKGGITAPSVGGQARALQAAYAQAGYGPGALDFIEGHGTGTRLGDKVELEAVAALLQRACEVQGEAAPRRRVGMTSLKSVIGHTKAAAGIGGFIKAVLAVHRRVLPPTANCQHPNAVAQAQAQHLCVLRHGAVWAPEAVLRAGVSAMGFGGINSHVTLSSGDAPQARHAPALPEARLFAHAQSEELVVLAAVSRTDLVTRLAQLTVEAEGLAAAELADLSAHCIAALEADAPWRAAFVVTSPEQLATFAQEAREALAAAPALQVWQRQDGRARVGVAIRARLRVGMLMPGQGVTLARMAARLVARFDAAEALVAQAQAHFAEEGCAEAAVLPWRSEVEAPDAATWAAWQTELRRTELAQPAQTLITVLWLRTLADFGIEPAVVVGHSLGELPALYAAGALDETQVLRLAALRGRLCHDALAQAGDAGTMVSLAVDATQAEAVLARDPVLLRGAGGASRWSIANCNSPRQTVVAGPRATESALLEAARAAGVGAVPLKVTGAFHTSRMATAAAKFLAEADVPAQPSLRCPMLSTAAARAGEDLAAQPLDARAYLATQLLDAVHFPATWQRLQASTDVLVEVGPGRVLTGLMRHGDLPSQLGPWPVESEAEAQGDLLHVLATLFVRGHALSWAPLHAGRLIRSFVPARARRFIDNPCERPAAPLVEVALPVAVAGSARPPSILPADNMAELAINSAPPLLSASALASYIEQRRSFLAAVVAADMESWRPTAARAPVSDFLPALAPVPGVAASFLAELPPTAPSQPASDASAALRPASVQAAVLGVVAERTGFAEADSVHPTGRYPRWVRDLHVVWVQAPFAALPQAEPRGPVRCLGEAPTGPWCTALRAAGLVVQTQGDLALPLSGGHLWLRLDPAERWPDRVQRLCAAVQVLEDAGAKSLTCAVDADRDPWPVSAFFASLHHERPDLRLRVLHFSASLDMATRLGCWRQALALPEYLVIRRYDAQGRAWQPRLQPLAPPLTPRQAPLQEGDTVLVTGGAKGITLACVRALAQATRVHLVLLGRSPVQVVHQTLAALRQDGVSCSYHACDVCDAAQVQAVVTAVLAERGRIDAVVHGAGLNRVARLARPQVEAVLAECAPKVEGLQHVLAQLQSRPPRLVAALTSVIGVVGMPGNAWYALSNAAAAAELERFTATHPETQIVALAYSVWADIGMGAQMGQLEALAARGIDAIAVPEGTARFVRHVLGQAGAGQVLVTGGLGEFAAAWHAPRPTLPAQRFIDKLLCDQAGVELLSRTELSLARDGYLADHCFRGSHLLPTVYGLEAMAQAVAMVLRQRALPLPLTLEDVELQAPIVVTPGQTHGIEVHAQVLPTAPGAAVQVQARLRSEHSGYARDHFAARFVLAGATPQVGDAPSSKVQALSAAAVQPSVETGSGGDGAAAVAVPVAEALYGGVLFQGPSFQRLRALDALSDTEARFQVEYRTEMGLLGDMHGRDVLLQSAQICASPKLCLPYRIERWQVAAVGSAAAGLHTGDTRIVAQTGDDYRIEVRLEDAAGQVVEHLEGYHMRAVAEDVRLPSAGEMVQLHGTLTVHLRRVVQVAAERLGFVAPQVLLVREPGLHAMPPAARHAIEAPVLAALGRHLLRSQAQNAAELSVAWHASGGPYLLEREDCGVSVAHDEEFCLYSAGLGAQGCDLLSLQQDLRTSWQSLFAPPLQAVLQDLRDRGISENMAGAVLWAATEAFAKAHGRRSEGLFVAASEADAWLLHDEALRARVLVVAVSVPSASQRVVALTEQQSSQRQALQQVMAPEQSALDHDDFFELKMRG
ncbi:MAG: SDR family NAD(P)-dependent oxidoreductase [Polyangiales bacterium]